MMGLNRGPKRKLKCVVKSSKTSYSDNRDVMSITNQKLVGM